MDLLAELDKIIALSEQISSITANQTTVILEETGKNFEESQLDGILEEMGRYKDQLINEVEEHELVFEKDYGKCKASLTDKAYIRQLKEKVSHVIEIKKVILDNEKSNMALMKSRIRQQNQVIELPKDAKKVAQAYKNSQL